MSDMMIGGISGQTAVTSIKKGASDGDTGKGFGRILEGAMGEVNHLQNAADQAVEELATGRSEDVHNTMIALQKADVSFQLLMQIRNKVVSAYETVMRMQI